MYAVKVSYGKTLEDAASPEEAQQAAKALLENTSGNKALDADLDGSISFSAGNPRVEHITGLVHLYRQVSAASDATTLPGVLPDAHGDRLCVLSLPPDMGVAEFCEFLGGYLSLVREMRLVRREGAGLQCLVLLRFDSIKTAALFYKDYNAKAFSSLEPEVICQLVFVKEVEVLSGEEAEPLRPPTGQTELPACPVCLERLDQHISGVVTTVCNHKFHNECLQRWGDTSCPVCRYCANATASTSHCSTCGTNQDLWICLICGHVGCGRYRSGHSVDHWKSTDHVYALELETQRVWDYVGDGYVHRLIQSKTDGKLVEVPSPAPAAASSTSRANAGGESCSSGENVGPHDQELHDAMFASKVDAFAAEYNHLLVSQLDSQRQFFEGLLRKHELDAQAATAEAARVVASTAAAVAQARAEAKDAKLAQHSAEQKLADMTRKFSELQKEKGFLKTLNDTAMLNQAEIRESLKSERAAAEVSKREAAAKIRELEEQVRDLMIFLDARQTIASSNGELAEGTVLPVEAPPVQPKRRQSSKRR